MADSKSFKVNSSIADNTNNAGVKNVKIVVPSEYLSNFWRTLEMPLTHCELTSDLNWSKKCVISDEDRVKTFAMASAELYVSIVTLSTQDNPKLRRQLKSEFKRTSNSNKYQSKKSTEVQN